MASRLERLFVLLESGSSNVTRRAAAQQLGEVQRLRPHELHRLLSRVYALIHSPAWETRIAAGQAFEAILQHVPQWNPQPYEIKKEEKPSEENHSDLGRLRFESFDIEKVISQGAHLTGSEGKEYEYEDRTSASDLREKLNRQRQQLNARLGLDKITLLSMDMDEMVTCHDLSHVTKYTEDDGRKPLNELVPLGAKLSSREMNRARRKARQQKSVPDDSSISKEEPDKKKFKPDTTTKLEEYMVYFGEWVPEPDGTWNNDIELWPLEGLACALATDLFSSQWETRHGAATALRELLRSHGAGAGKETGCTSAEMEEMHQIWLEDISLRLLCVLALDRFGDFVSDQVVAPVRETCAQCLGVAVSLIGSKGISQVASFLNTLTQDQSHWEGRHGALLGLKYILAVQQELGLKSEVFPAVIRALWDPVEDIAAAAARALIPVTELLIQCIPMIIPLIVGRLRRLLLAHDELGAACGCYMSLLAALLAEPNIKTILGCKYMESVIPRLWPYLSHPTSSVRKSALQTLQTLTKCSTDNGAQYDDATDEGFKMLNKEKVKQDCMDKLGFAFDDVDSIDEEDVQWNSELLQEALRHVFQRVLVEHIYDIKVMIEDVWKNLVISSKLEHLLTAACPFMSTWICLAMQPAKVAFEVNQLIHCKQFSSGQTDHERDEITENINRSLMRKFYLGGSETVAYSIRENNVLLTRCMASRMLGILSCYIIQPAPNVVYLPDMDKPIDQYTKILLLYITSKSANQRLIMGLMISHWAKLDANIRHRSGDFSEQLINCLTQPIYFDEIAITCSKILQDASDFVALMHHYKIPLEMNEINNTRSLEQVVSLTSQYSEQLLSKTKLKTKVAQMLEERRKSVLMAATQCSNDQNSYSISTMAALASACVNLKIIPEKINPIIKPLMESIKREENECLQQVAADNLAPLLSQCVDRLPCPNVKVLNNLCAFLKSDFDFTPRITEQNNEKASTARDAQDNKNGILTLTTQQKNIERAVYKKSSNGSTTPLPRGPGRPPLTDFPMEELFPLEDEMYKLLHIQRRGATLAFISLTVYFGEQLPEKLPKLWKIIMQPLEGTACDNENISVAEGEEIISCLQVLEVVIPHVHKSLLPRILNSLERLTSLLENVYKAVRHMASRCIAALADIEAATVMHIIVNKVIPLLGVIDSDIKRQGASEVLACIIDKLQLNIVPYSVLLVVPLLGRMSDHDDSVRLMCTHCFATLIQFMPLDGAIKEQSTLSEELKAQRAKDTLFLQQLFNPKTIGDYQVPVSISAEIRSYQQAGINWLAFLNKYKLHGVLCDDMGLGKTLQSICMIAGDHYNREQIYVKTKSADCAPLPSLVVCPPTLTGHWVYEVNKFLPNNYLMPLHYTGPPIERDRLKIKVKNHNLVIASYDIVRKDIDFFARIKWNYCVLDEGHIIKNGNTKASKAIKTLAANHRLILSGTPIQNNVLELWSLFDFLMPGLLGTARQFTARYSRPILAARDPKATSQHQEAGALAMEALHRQVLPFLLRRVKEDVLKELPPKITQDYYCELSPLQKRLYEDFSKTHMPNGIEEGVKNHHHIFQALRYLQNVCNHPKLVLTPQHPEYVKITLGLAVDKSSLNDINHSAKLPALKQLLLDCGIGTADTNVLSEHRALIFCQLKGMLEVVENDLLKPLLPQVSYLRLDGTVSPSQRQSVVQRFNNDPSIDVLLLTTQVGGLGLNLTGADTVIFVEHDWNPMKDLQAMDRAHRIGQKKVVNVYRLITRGTLEEKIMGLQKFKLYTANTVISGENSSLDTMGTDHLLDLFTCKDKDKSHNKASASSATGTAPITMKTILENLPDLWDDNQYEAEYDMDNFVQNLSKK